MKKLFEGISRFIKGIVNFLRFGSKAGPLVPVAPALHKPETDFQKMWKRLGRKKRGPRFQGQPAWVRQLMLDKAVEKRLMRVRKRIA